MSSDERTGLGLGAELGQDLRSAKAIAALSAGATSGLGLLVAHVAYGSYIYSGPLAPYATQGVGLVLFANFAACLVVALAGGFRGGIAGLPPALLLVMALIGSSMDVAGEALFVTTAAALMIGATATGVLCILIGRFHLANLVRFIPYPVASGFVAGIGGAVCLAAMSMMGTELDWRDLPAALAPDALLRWVPGAAFGAGLYLATKRWRNPLVLPVSVVLAVAAYHAALTALGVDSDQARASGLLFESTMEGTLWPALAPADLALVDWTALGGQVPNILTLVLVALVCVTMNTAGLELAAGEELDWDREFQATGLGSVVAGLGGGAVGSMIVPASLRSKLLGAATRWTGIVAALVIGTALVFGDGMLELVPVSLIGGMLFFAGLGMLDEGLVRTRKRLPWTDYGIIVLIFLAITGLGLLEGVGTGMLATLVFFAVRLSRVDLVESEFDLSRRRSNRARPVPERTILQNEGGRAIACRLRGYLFFGSVSPLIERLGQMLETSSRPSCLALDFAQVSGVDFSAVNALARYIQNTQASGVQVVLSSMTPDLQVRLERNLPPEVLGKIALAPDLDRALERCENHLIATWQTDSGDGDTRRSLLLGQTAADIERQLERQIEFEELLEQLEEWAQVREWAAGEEIAGRRGAIHLLATGQASVLGSDGERLQQLGPGDAIWPAGAGARTRVEADGPCRVVTLDSAGREQLESQDGALALRLYRYLLASRAELEGSL